MLMIYAGRRQGAIVMTNGDEGWVLYDEIVRTIAKEYGWPPAPEFGWLGQLAHEHAPAAIDPQIYAAYAGTYELRPDFHLTVTTSNGVLFVRLAGQPPLQLYPLSETEFFAKDVHAEVRFDQADSGAVAGLSLRQNQHDMPARKLS